MSRVRERPCAAAELVMGHVSHSRLGISDVIDEPAGPWWAISPMAMETDLPPTQPDNQNNVEDEASSQAHHQNQPSPNDHQGRTGGLQIRVRNKIPQPIKVVPPPNWGMVEDGTLLSPDSQPCDEITCAEGLVVHQGSIALDSLRS